MKTNSKLRWLALTGVTGALWLGGPAALHADDAKIAELEQRIKILERKLELAVESAEARAKAAPEAAKAVSDAPKLTADSRGIKLESADKAFVFKVNGLLQFDGRFYTETGSSAADTFEARRVRPTLQGTLWNDLEFRFTPELSGTVRILDAYADYKASDAFRVRFGNFKTPVGLERLQGGGSLRFNERGYATEFTPGRDLGIQLHGKVINKSVEWKVGVFNGAVDGFNGAASTAVNNTFDLAASLFANPFKGSDTEALRGLGVGIAGSWGRRNNSDAAFRIRTTSRLDVARGSLLEDGTTYRLNPQLTYYYGPFGFLGEYIISSRHLGTATKAFQRYDSNAWTLQASYVLTGEDNSYGSIRPKNPFKLDGDGWGAWELAVRYTGVRLDKDIWTNGLLGAGQANKANTWSVGVNWYATDNLQASLSYDNTHFSGGQTGGGDRKSDQAILTRLQVSF